VTDNPVPDTPAKDALVPPPEVIEVSQIRVSCDGGGGALGHPRVWMTIAPEKGYVECGYCDRKFVLRADADPGH
jgi:uncharacterized Zn-finger protein